MIYVEVHSSETLDSALKRFSLKIQQSGLLKELKEHTFYEKPSEVRRRKQKQRPSRP